MKEVLNFIMNNNAKGISNNFDILLGLNEYCDNIHDLKNKIKLIWHKRK